MRQVVLDTETTGLEFSAGHKIIEIGCIELVKRRFTGRNLHLYLNPEREIDAGALRVHGISNEFLQDKPLFADIAEQFIDFVDGAELIIHNAPFDVGFLNSELASIKHPSSLEAHCSILDTLIMAREMHPGQRNNLDALCKRYNVNNANRQLHGALLDAEILAFVYLAMTGGQAEFFSSGKIYSKENSSSMAKNQRNLSSNSPVIAATTLETSRHKEFLEEIL